MMLGDSPLARYQRDLARPDFVTDAAQRRAVDAFESLFVSLVSTPPGRDWRGRRRAWTPVEGLYLWGGVGRGKTYLMDLFYEALPFQHKLRTHFHRFMLDIHRRRRDYANTVDPLLPIAKDIAAEVRVLCFDEFFISDIGDAMILGRLLDALFEQGVCLVATSNLVPDQLYRDGLQRERFLPAIEQLKARVHVLNVDGGTDYRLRSLTQMALYHQPDDAHADEQMSATFKTLAPEPRISAATITLNERELLTEQMADGVIWFSFKTLCEGPRSVSDYIELAQTHHTVLISHVPALGVDGDDPARRFVHLVDAFYDRNIKLVISAAAPITTLYQGQKLRFEFERTCSRLLEMQSEEYLARPHLP
jgi:cell division protein ZapE